MQFEIQAAISSVTSLKDIAFALIAERDRQKAATIEADLTKRIAEAQAALLHVLGIAGEQAEALRVARERIGQLESEQREAQRYKLVEVVPGRGLFAYRLRPAAELDERQDEPVHFLCQTCRDSGIKSVLQRSENGSVMYCRINAAHNLTVGAERVFSQRGYDPYA